MKPKLLILLTAVLHAVPGARAYNHLWTGAASDSWSQGMNWTNGVPNPTENRAMRLFFPAFGTRLNTRQDIEGLMVDYMEVNGSYRFGGGPGATLGFRDTNGLSSSSVSLRVEDGAIFDSDLGILLTMPIGVWAQPTSHPTAVAGYFNGPITGSGEFHHYGGGRLEFGGEQANTFAGDMLVHSGTLRLNKEGAAAIAGQLIAGNGSTGDIGAKVLCLRPDQFAAGASVILQRDGWLDFDDQAQTLAGLTLNGGRLSTGTGFLFLSGDVGAGAAPTNSLIEGQIFLGFYPRTFNVTSDSATNGLHVTAQILGASGAALIKEGPGWLTLAGSNTYVGSTLVNEGVLRVTELGSLGGVDYGTAVAPGASLCLVGANLGEEPLSLAGAGHNSLGALQVVGNSACGGHVFLPAEAALGVWPGRTLALGGVISGSGGLRLKSGTVQLSGNSANTFTGTTRVDGGTLELRKQYLIIGQDAIGLTAVPGPLVIGDGAGVDIVRLFTDNGVADSAPVTLAANGRLDVNGRTDTIGSLSSAGGWVDLGDGQLTVGGNGLSTTCGAVIAGAGGRLRKIGPGSLTLTASSTYNAGTFIEGGTLVVEGSIGNVAVKTNGTIAGTGSVGVLAVQGGGVSPGSGPGRLRSQSVAFNSAASGSIYRVELHGTVASTSHDQLSVSGSVNLGGCALAATLGFAGAPGNQYVIIANDGVDPVLGTFAGKPEGATLAFDGATFQVSYQGGDGNDVVLTQLAASAQEFAPSLAIETAAAGQVRLLWTTNAVGFQLETATSLPTMTWLTVPGAPVLAGDRFGVTLPASTNVSFFRLRHP